MSEEKKTKFDITSTVLEKSVDLARMFVDKLIMPSVEETGLLIKDQVTRWRFNNQIKILNKSKAYCEKNGIDPKTISLKLLCPLLDYAGLEEDETLQDKWSIMLGNMVDSDQNIQNHVFPYILGQLSCGEFSMLETAYSIKRRHVKSEKLRLEEFRTNRPSLEQKMSEEIEILTKQRNDLMALPGGKHSTELWDIREKKRKLDQKKSSLSWSEQLIISSIIEPMRIPHEEIEEYEISNLVRLGVIKQEIPETYINPQQLEIANPNPEYEGHSAYLTVDLDIEVETAEGLYVLTELGELFIQACSEKEPQTDQN
ncbi:MAG: hypothetical protein ACI8ZM_004855 [Crocinitomix sp.]|jgi:hypothetical protein